MSCILPHSQACCSGQPERSWRVRKSLNLHDFWEVIVHQDHVGSLFADVCPRLSHGDPDIRGFQGHGVVDTIPCHWHHSTSPLQSLWGRTAQRLSSHKTNTSCWQFQSLCYSLCFSCIERSEALFDSEGKTDLAPRWGQNSDPELRGWFLKVLLLSSNFCWSCEIPYTPEKIVSSCYTC